MAALGPNNTPDNLNGNFKKVYMKGNDVVRLIPQSVKIYPEMEFIPTEKQGGASYNVPVQLQGENGFSYGGSQGLAFALNDSVAGEVNEATVKGCELVLRSTLSIAAAARSEKGGEVAFIRVTKLLVQSMQEAMHKRLEMQTLYGQVGLAAVASVSGNDITISDASFASGIWCGSRGMKLSVYAANLTTLRGSCQITAVNIETKTISVDLLPVGTVATDVIFEFGANGKEFAGIHKILSNTGSLFGIDAAIYELWRGTVYSVAGNLSLPKIQAGIAQAVGKGLDEDMDIYLSPVTWEKLATDQAALRRFDYSYKEDKAKAGHRSLEFFSQNGTIRIIPHMMVKQGFAYGLVMSDFEKVGSTDVTFLVPGRGEEFFKLLEAANGYELRCYADVAIICHKPNKQLLFTGITNA